MSLRSIGNQLLQTAPSSLLYGASTASLSLWIRINPGNNIADANGVEVFGDAGGKLSATLTGTGNLRLRWSSVDGNSSGSSSCNLTLALGTSYHLAAVWQDGAQHYYLDGVLVESDTQHGSIGVLGDVATHPFRIGSDSAGTDASLDDPTLWIGYALGAQDVANLRDRAVSPSSIAPSSIALRWSLSGPDGIAARVGDPGLADASPSGLDLSSVVGSAPSYQAAALTYLAPPLRAMVAPSGESFVIRPMDARGNYAKILSIQSGNEENTFSPSRSTVGGSFTATINGETTSPLNYTAVQPGRLATFQDIAVIPGHVYRIKLVAYPGIFYRDDTLVEVVQDGLVVQSGRLDQYTPSIAGDAVSGDTIVANDTGAGTVIFRAITAPTPATFTPTGTTISVRMSAPDDVDHRRNNWWTTDAIRVEDVTAGTFAIVDDVANFVAAGADIVSTAGYGEFYHGSHAFYFSGNGAGSTFTYDSADTIKAAFEALPSVGAGNVAVTIVLGKIHVEFINALGATAIGVMTSTNPAITFGRVAGGFVPSIVITPQGGSPGAPIRLTHQWIPIQSGLTWAIYWFDAGQATKFVATDSVSVTIPAGWMTLAGTNDVQTITFANNPSGGTFTLSGTHPITGGPFATIDPIAWSSDPRTLDGRIQDRLAGLLGDILQVKNSAVTWINGAQSRPVALMTADGSLLTGPGAQPTATVVHTTTGVLGSTLTPGAYAAENHVGGSMLPPFDAAPKTMPIGYNIQSDNYFSRCLTYTNMWLRAGNDRIGPLGNGDFRAWDANGDPTKLARNTAGGNIVSPAYGILPDGVGGTGAKLAPFGKYTFLWDGPFDRVNVSGEHTSFREDESLRVVSNATNNRRVYDAFSSDGAWSHPWISFNFDADAGGPDADGLYNCSVKNIRIYPPDPSDPTGQTPWLDPASTMPGLSGKYHPSFLAKLATARSIRPLQPLDAPYNAYADFDQIKPDNWLDRATRYRVQRVQVAEIRQYTGPALDRPNVVLFQFKTVEPHGFFDGMRIFPEHCGTANLSDPRFPRNNPGGGLNFDGGGEMVVGTVSVIDDHTFVFHGFECNLGGDIGPVDGVTMTNVLTKGDVAPGVPGGILNGGVNGYIGGYISLADCADLVNDLDIKYPGTPRRLWFAMAVTATDACIDAIGDFFAARLRPGIGMNSEAGNECWNYVYSTYSWLTTRSFQMFGGALGYTPAYTVVQGNINRRLQARFDAAGRGADFVHVFCTFSATADVTDAIGGYALNPPNGDAPYRVDEVAIAPYTNNYAPGFGQLQPTDQDYDPTRFGNNPLNLDFVRMANLSAGMCLDILELNTDDPGFSFTADKREALDRYYPDARIVTYEGLWESLIPGMSLGSEFYFDPGPAEHPTTVLYPLQRAINRHPRIHGITLRELQKFQDEGISLHNRYHAGGSENTSVWSTYEWYDEQPGTGDPAENPDYRNTSALTTSGQVPVKSQVGGAIDHWNSLVDAMPSTIVAGTATAGTTTNTTATATATEAMLATGPVAHQWYRSLISGQDGSPVAGQTTLNLSDTGLTPGTPYYYRLKYTDSNGSAYSNQVTATTTGGMATLKAGSATAGATTSTTAGATATEATGGTVPYVHQWYRSLVSGQVGMPVAGQTALTLADSALSPGHVYYYQLRYTDANGAGSSVFSNQFSVMTASVVTTAAAHRLPPYGTTPTSSGDSSKRRRAIR